MNRIPFRRRYGAHPIHLLLIAAALALAGYAAVRLLTGRTLEVALWVVGGALIHDLVLVPLYSGADLTAQAAVNARAERTGPGASAGPGRGAVNYLRVPTYLALLLLLVWFPLILRLSQPYTAATGLSQDVYLGRWLLITAGLFAASAALLAGRLWVLRRRSHRRKPHRPAKKA
ncbi:hypothetical protein ACIQF6_03110 [Kitasatospora sp. NPDC092948]|uniref:hypothetical protein n=1 Tax=Kitasatospora sp. NPDC092948 TaxID=3364088 RepID=UPI00380A2331